MSLRRVSEPPIFGTAFGNSRRAWRSNTSVLGPLFTEGTRLETGSALAIFTSGLNTWLPFRIPGRRDTISSKTRSTGKSLPLASYQNGDSRWSVSARERS